MCGFKPSPNPLTSLCTSCAKTWEGNGPLGRALVLAESRRETEDGLSEAGHRPEGSKPGSPGGHGEDQQKLQHEPQMQDKNQKHCNTTHQMQIQVWAEMKGGLAGACAGGGQREGTREAGEEARPRQISSRGSGLKHTEPG